MDSSPFLHREAPAAAHRQAYVHEADRLAAERERGRLTLERLRYRWWERRGTLACHMQRLGDWGREYFPAFARRGWW